MTERDLQDAAMALLKLHGYRTYHVYDSRRSAPGFPDIIAVRGERLFAIECKAERGRTTRPQREWLTALMGVKQVDAFVLRPGPDLSALEELLR